MTPEADPEDVKAALDEVSVELMPDAVLMVDGAARIVTCNRLAETLFRYPPGKLVGTPLEALVPGESRAAHRRLHHAFFAEAAARAMGERRTFSAQRRDGSTVPVQISLSVLQRHGCSFAMATVRDATAAIQAQTRLAEIATELEEAQRTAQLGCWRWNPETETSAWSAGMYALHGRDPESGPLRADQSLSEVHPDDQARVRAAFAQALSGGETIELDYRHRGRGREWRTVHAITRPDRDRPGCYCGTLQDVTARHRTEQALREHTDALNLMLDAAPIGMAIVGADTRFTRVNPALCAMLGYTEAEMLGMTVAQVTHPEDREAAVAMHTALLAGTPGHHERRKRYVRSDGQTIWASVSLAGITDPENHARSVIAQIQDITAEREAADTRARLEAVVGAAPDALVTATITGVVTSWPPAAERICGYSPAEAIGQNMAVLTSPESERGGLLSRFADIAAGVVVAPFEARGRHADGTEVDLSITMSPIVDPDRSILGVIGIIRDISTQKAAQRELELVRARLERAELAAGMGNWEWDPGTDEVFWSAGLYALFGLSSDAATIDLAYGLAHRVHPDDRERLRQILTDAAERLTPIHTRCRIIRGDGRIRTAELNTEPMIDPSGQSRIVGVVRDITEEIRTRESLTTASANLSAYAQELGRLATPQENPGATALTDRQLKILHLIAKGLNTRAIAKEMFLSEPTIKWHVKQILAKTGAANRAEAVARVLGGGPEM